MKQKEQVWVVSATCLSLAGFSFFAGYGARYLYSNLARNGRAAAGSPVGFQVASAAQPKGLGPDLRPAELYMEVYKKLQVYYVEQTPGDTAIALGSVDAMLNQLGDPNTRLLTKTEVDALQSEERGEYPGLGAVLTVTRYNSHEGETPAVTKSGQPATKVIGKLPAQSPRTEEKAAPSPGVRTITVVSVAPGSPAEKAGLKAKDHITEIDGHWIAPAHVSYRILTQLTDDLGPQDGRPVDPEERPQDQTPQTERDKINKEAAEQRAKWKNATEMPQVIPQLLTANGGDHELTIERGVPQKTIKVKVTLGSTTLQPVTSKKVNDTTGYVQILAFNGSTVQQVTDAVNGFKTSGVKNLVLDLRNSAGGSMEVARAVGGLFMGEAKFATLRSRDAAGKMADRALMTSGGAPKWKPGAVSVLVDAGTAGSSELLAAALRDNLGARLVGSTTFGDGSEQMVARLENGSGVSITRAHMLTSKGVEFDTKGLQADAPAGSDALDAAVKALSRTGVARNGS